MFYTQKELYRSGMFVFIIALVANVYAGDTQVTVQDLSKKVAAGSVAGFAEGFTGLPFNRLKILAQLSGSGAKPQLGNPLMFYNGFWINALCIVPTTGAQVSINYLLERVVPGDGFAVAATRSSLAGALSAILVSTPAEMLIQHKRNGAPFVQVVRHILEQRGIRGLWSGGVAKSARDAGFTLGFLTLYPRAESTLHDRGAGSSAQYLAAVCAGIPTTVITHPCDTVSTYMQERIDQPMSATAAVKQLYDAGGARAFFKGVSWRAARVSVALLTMDAIKKRVEEAL